MDAGFERGDPGQLLVVQPIEILKPAGAAPLRVYFAFVPAGRFALGGLEICKRDPRAVVPEVGYDVVLLPFRAAAGEAYLNLEYEGSLIVLPASSTPRLPRILSSEAATPGVGSKAGMIRRIRALVAGTER